MSPLFGHGDGNQDQTDKDALQAEVDRLDSLPLPELAAEVMAKGFGPGGQGADKDGTVTVGGPNINAGVTVAALAADFVPGAADEGLRVRRDRLVAEGFQALEHAALVRAQLHTAMGSLDYTVTRTGRAALESNSVAQILSGGTP
ncbi:MAG TPA: hypothetical protein VHU85_13375 [Acidimicrobiales bacterium]|jgi:hypothetical protein|nr:hypothetical protein [Acidimicrobiales bacterium]